MKRDEPGAAFKAQFFFLAKRFKQLRVMDLAASAHRITASDYLFVKDKIYVCLNLNDVEIRLYDEYYDLFAEQVPVPDLVIYL